MSQLLNSVSKNIKLRNMSRKTEAAYVQWIKECILFHQKKHPKELNEKHIQSFLTHLAVNKNYSPSTQSQTLNAIVFLYREVLDQRIGDFSLFRKAKPKTHIPVVFSKSEAKTIILSLLLLKMRFNHFKVKHYLLFDSSCSFFKLMKYING